MEALCMKLTLAHDQLDADRRDIWPEAGLLPTMRSNTRA
jgi:hypothetical protein